MFSRFLFFVLPTIFHIICVHINALKRQQKRKEQCTMKKNETTKTNVTKKVTGMLMALFMLICSVPVPAAAPNNFVISDNGIVGGWTREDMVIGNWECPAAGVSMTIDEKGGFVSSSAAGCTGGKWLLEDDFLTLNSKTGDSKMFACKGETLEEVGGDCFIFYSKDELKKPSTAAKKVSAPKYAGYWKASEVISHDELMFTKMFLYANKKGRMNIYMQQNFGVTKRVAKAVKLKLSKKKDCVSFKTRINRKTVKGVVYLDRGTAYAIIDGGRTAIRFARSSKAELRAATASK